MRIITFLVIVFLIISCQNTNNRELMDINTIICEDIGIDGLKNIISQHPIPSEELEQQWVKSHDFNRLYLHHLIYSYGVARKYYFHWIPKETLIDESIKGFRKGVDNYLVENRNFRLGHYVVWWSKQSCLEYIIKEIWSISIPLQDKSIPKDQLENIFIKITHGNQNQLIFLREYYQFLFQELDAKYADTGIEIQDQEKEDIIIRVFNNQLSFPDLLEEQYDYLLGEMDFEDKILLEYALTYEIKLK